MAARYWRCRRQKHGIVCGTLNLGRKRLCTACGGRKPARRKPAHTKALDMPYEQCIRLFGEHCGICGATPKPGGRRLHRDHEHKANGYIRGTLCFRCNTALRSYLTIEWLRAAADYLEHAQAQQTKNDTR